MKKYAIVTDFDGTLTTKDIAHEICLHHEITSKDQIQTSYDTDDEAKNWMISHFAQVKTTPKEFERFVLKIAKPRKHLKELKHFCKTEKLPFEIVSGGLDIYIKPILKNMGFEDTPFFSATAKISDDGVMVSYPLLEDYRLDDFKASRVQHYKDLGYTTIFCGDGITDFRAAEKADILFACRSLAKACDIEEVKYTELEDFKKILEIVKNK